MEAFDTGKNGPPKPTTSRKNCLARPGIRRKARGEKGQAGEGKGRGAEVVGTSLAEGVGGREKVASFRSFRRTLWVEEKTGLKSPQKDEREEEGVGEVE